MKMILLCIANTFCMTIGQILFKYSASKVSINGVYDMFKLLLTPTVILALGIYGGGVCLWLYILNNVELSFAYPIQALTYPMVMSASYFLFKEHISVNGWVGIAVICIGIIIATR